MRIRHARLVHGGGCTRPLGRAGAGQRRRGQGQGPHALGWASIAGNNTPPLSLGAARPTGGAARAFWAT